MRYLFCKNENEDYDKPGPEELFVLNTVSDSLAKRLEKAEEEFDNTIKKFELPGLFRIIKWICIIATVTFISGIMRSEVSFREGYNNAPWVFYVGGITLILAIILSLIEFFQNHKMDSSESIKESERKSSGAVKTAKEYLGVPPEAYECDILNFDYLENGGRIEIDGGAFFEECSIFEKDENVCIFHGLKNLYAIPKHEVKGISVTDMAVTMFNWNKEDPASDEKYQAGGMVEDEGLKFFYTMEIEHDGRPYGLAFPAYEMDAVSDVTGMDPADNRYTGSLRSSASEETDATEYYDNKVRPVFYWRFPKEQAGLFLSSQADFGFKSMHPVMYPVLMAIGIILMFLPAVIFYLIGSKVPGSDENVGIFIGAVGGFIMGIGFFNIVSAFLKQYLGHIVTLAAVLLGGALMVAGYALLIG